jgi:hypothetical protein
VVGLSSVASLVVFVALYALGEHRYLDRTTPLRRWPLLPVAATLTPLHILLLLFADDTVEWRGQRLRVHRGGRFEVL